MKKYCIKICLLILFNTCNNHSYSQQKATGKLSDFVIVICQNDKGILLESSKGCAWKELEFNTLKEQGIDNYGMSNGHESEKDLKFYFTIVKTKTGMNLKGMKGMAWKELSFTVKKNKKYEVTKSGVKQI